MGGWMLVVGRWSLVFGRWSSATRRWSLVAAVIVLGLVPVARAFPPSPKASAASEVAGLWETGTFSILGYDPDTGEVGGAVQSRVFSVGNGVLWAEADDGAVATQLARRFHAGFGVASQDRLNGVVRPLPYSEAGLARKCR